jgi:hypothetical protein
LTKGWFFVIFSRRKNSTLTEETMARSELASAAANTLADGMPGIIMGLAALDGIQVLHLFEAVKGVTGEQLWRQFTKWRDAGNKDKSFDTWACAQIEIWKRTRLSPRSHHHADNGHRRQQPGTIEPRRTTNSSTLRSQVRNILRSATSKEEAKDRIKRAVKKYLQPRPKSCSVSVCWSTVPDSRSVSINPEGHSHFSASVKTAK